MTIEEQNEKANDAITARLTQLNAALEKAELKLREMRIPKEIWHTIRSYEVDTEYSVTDFEQVGVMKVKGEWCLCYGHGREYDGGGEPEFSPKPYRECSIEERIEVANNLEGLRKEIVKAKEEFVGTITEALGNLGKFMDE